MCVCGVVKEAWAIVGPSRQNHIKTLTRGKGCVRVCESFVVLNILTYLRGSIEVGRRVRSVPSSLQGTWRPFRREIRPKVSESIPRVW